MEKQQRRRAESKHWTAVKFRKIADSMEDLREQLLGRGEDVPENPVVGETARAGIAEPDQYDAFDEVRSVATKNCRSVEQRFLGRR
uniref:Uncharacterized protein n=1 Tax=Acrobeloides nanus TaxID=290746 RepID=A0A914CDP6_9BILA